MFVKAMVKRKKRKTRNVQRDLQNIQHQESSSQNLCKASTIEKEKENNQYNFKMDQNFVEAPMK